MKYRYRFIVYLFLLILVLVFLITAFCVGILISHLKIAPEPSQPEGSLEGCFVVAQRIPFYPSVYTVGNLMERIIQAESGGNPEAYNPTSGAHGLCQFIPSTKKYVERKWRIDIDWSNPEQQKYACQRLLQEEGTKHWKESKNVWLKHYSQ